MIPAFKPLASKLYSCIIWLHLHYKENIIGSYYLIFFGNNSSPSYFAVKIYSYLLSSLATPGNPACLFALANRWKISFSSSEGAVTLFFTQNSFWWSRTFCQKSSVSYDGSPRTRSSKYPAIKLDKIICKFLVCSVGLRLGNLNLRSESNLYQLVKRNEERQ